MPSGGPFRRLVTGRRLLIVLAVAAALALLPWLAERLRGKGEKPVQTKRAVQRITIIQPPPPPPAVKPPEPKPPEPQPEEPKPLPRTREPDPGPEKSDQPPKEHLGVDGEPGVGTDAFGLEARPGGLPLLGGGGGNALLWYGGQLQHALEGQLQSLLAGTSARTSRYSVILDVWVDAGGRVGRAQLAGSSGRPDVDLAIRNALPRLHFALQSAPPPSMPQPVRLRISTQY